MSGVDKSWFKIFGSNSSKMDTPKTSSTSLSSRSLSGLVDIVESEFHLSTDVLKTIMDGFLVEFAKGLSGEISDLPMLPTYITGRPTGKEIGQYLAIDLGGSNVRVCLVKLNGEDKPLEFINEKYEIAEELKVKHIDELFSFVADKMESFMKRQNMDLLIEHKLGFTFSFPVKQERIDMGTLVRWNKGFECEGAVDEDIVNLMQKALVKRGLKTNIVAIVNDTAGTLLSSGIYYPNTLTGVILGTGTNAAYYEKCEKIKTIKDTHKEMIINTEWGNFDTQKLIVPCTVHDHRLDRETSNPYMMIFEKMVSGKYLGEIARLVIIYLIDNMVLFKGRSTILLNTPYKFPTKYLTEIVGEPDNLDIVKSVLVRLGVNESSSEEHISIVRVCKAIGERAARMSAAAIAAIVQQRGDCFTKEVTVGIDGSLYKFYPDFKEHVKSALKEIIGKDKTSKIRVESAEDGSGIGAALAAMTTEFS